MLTAYCTFHSRKLTFVTELAFQFVWDLANIQQPSVGRTDIVSKVLCVYIFIMVALACLYFLNTLCQPNTFTLPLLAINLQLSASKFDVNMERLY